MVIPVDMEKSAPRPVPCPVRDLGPGPPFRSEMYERTDDGPPKVRWTGSFKLQFVLIPTVNFHSGSFEIFPCPIQSNSIINQASTMRVSLSKK